MKFVLFTIDAEDVNLILLEIRPKSKYFTCAVSPLKVTMIISGQTAPFPIPSSSSAVIICNTKVREREIAAVSIHCLTTATLVKELQITKDWWISRQVEHFPELVIKAPLSFSFIFSFVINQGTSETTTQKFRKKMAVDLIASFLQKLGRSFKTWECRNNWHAYVSKTRFLLMIFLKTASHWSNIDYFSLKRFHILRDQSVEINRPQNVMNFKT